MITPFALLTVIAYVRVAPRPVAEYCMPATDCSAVTPMSPSVENVLLRLTPVVPAVLTGVSVMVTLPGLSENWRVPTRTPGPPESEASVASYNSSEYVPVLLRPKVGVKNDAPTLPPAASTPVVGDLKQVLLL